MLAFRSPVYIWRDGQFRLDHHIDTQQASDIETINVNGSIWLAVTGKSATTEWFIHHVALAVLVNIHTGTSGVSLFQWSSQLGMFVPNITIGSPGAFQVEGVPYSGIENREFWGNKIMFLTFLCLDFLLVTNRAMPGQLFQFPDLSELQVCTIFQNPN